jgi:hypothetical protein
VDPARDARATIEGLWTCKRGVAFPHHDMLTRARTAARWIITADAV